MGRTYLNEYKSKVISAEKAAQLVQSGDKIAWGHVNAKPVDFDVTLAARKDELRDVQIWAGCTVPPVPQVLVADPKNEHFVYQSVYYSPIERAFSAQGIGYHLPMNYHEGYKNFTEISPPDITVVRVAPMDECGYFNFGPQPSYHDTVCHAAKKYVIVEVNDLMPAVRGGFGEAIHISEVDFIVEGTPTPLYCTPVPEKFSEENQSIASHIMKEMQDGVCLQLGIGELPVIIGEYINDSDLKDLSVHSEMFVDPFVKLFESGKINGRLKKLDNGKMVYTFALASQECYEFMSNSPAVLGYACQYACNPAVIAQIDNMYSINSCIQVDLFSQVCSESAGYRQVSGTGGQLDFVEGAFNSNGGKSFMCLNSTFVDKDGELRSNIVPTLVPGSIVTTPRSVVDYVVTEYGLTRLKAKSTWQRAESLIAIAHPKFQDQLVKEAEKMGIWRKSQKVTV